MKSTKEKPTPIPCVCGKRGIIVKTRSGRMISCPNPEKCPTNLRTMWHSSEESAIVEWNGMVQAERYRRKLQ